MLSLEIFQNLIHVLSITEAIAYNIYKTHQFQSYN